MREATQPDPAAMAALAAEAAGAAEAAEAAELRATRAVEYRALALMYAAQGLPAGLAFMALGPLIRQGGHGVAQVGLVGLAFLPWALKFLWAAPMDNACARWGYGRVVAVTQALIIVAALALVPLDPGEHLYGALTGILLLNTLAATQDIATNAYAVSRLQGRAAGPANAIQVAGFIVGMLLGGGGFLMTVDWLGWRGAMLCLAGLLLAIYLPLMLDSRWARLGVAAAAGRGVESGAAGGGSGRAVTPVRIRLRDLRQHADLWWALLLALLFKFPGTAIDTLSQPWLVDRGLSLAQIGSLQTLRLLVTALGAVLIGIALVRRLGNRRAVAVSALLAFGLLGTTWALEFFDIRDLRAIYLAFVLESLAAGALYVAIWALVMNWASPARPGTDYTAMQCAESLANAMAAGVIGGIGARWGYGTTFAAAWAVGALVFGFLLLALGRIRLGHDADPAGGQRADQSAAQSAAQLAGQPAGPDQSPAP